MEIELKRLHDGELRKFGKEHATALMRLSGTPTWEVSDEQYKFNGHDIIKRASTKRNRKSEKED